MSNILTGLSAADTAWRTAMGKPLVLHMRLYDFFYHRSDDRALNSMQPNYTALAVDYYIQRKRQHGSNAQHGSGDAELYKGLLYMQYTLPERLAVISIYFYLSRPASWKGPNNSTSTNICSMHFGARTPHMGIGTQCKLHWH
jgi:hypothetical protein